MVTGRAVTLAIELQVREQEAAGYAEQRAQHQLHVRGGVVVDRYGGDGHPRTSSPNTPDRSLFQLRLWHGVSSVTIVVLAFAPRSLSLHGHS